MYMNIYIYIHMYMNIYIYIHIYTYIYIYNNKKIVPRTSYPSTGKSWPTVLYDSLPA